MSHLGDTNKMVETPRTNDQIGYDGSTMSAIRIEFARQLERELNAANDRIKRLEEARTVAAANSLATMMSYEDAIAKIKRLEEAGDAMFPWSERVGQEFWTKAREDKP